MSTLDRMIAAGTLVQGSCRKCGSATRVDLQEMVQILGPDGSLWDRHPPCPKLECGGELLFLAAASPSTPTRPLKSPFASVMTEWPIQSMMGGWTGMEDWTGVRTWRPGSRSRPR